MKNINDTKPGFSWIKLTILIPCLCLLVVKMTFLGPAIILRRKSTSLKFQGNKYNKHFIDQLSTENDPESSE